MNIQGIGEGLNTFTRIAEKTENHPKVSEALYTDRKYLVEHPEIATTLYKNRNSLNNNPELFDMLLDHHKMLDTAI